MRIIVLALVTLAGCPGSRVRMHCVRNEPYKAMVCEHQNQYGCMRFAERELVRCVEWEDDK